ncbi:MAG: c-type cytochrome [Acidobacteria bacterium]|nr:c-type cytochrome [Acidobacteriota bacterium]
MATALKGGSLILLITALIGLYAAGWPWSTDMVLQPSLAPFEGPRPPVEGTLPVEGDFALQRWQMEQLLKNPLPQSAAGIEKGRFLFSMYCSPCHGTQGRGDGPVVKVFVQPGDLRHPAVQAQSDAWMYGTIRNGENMMPRYGPELSVRERWQIVQYVKSFKVSP